MKHHASISPIVPKGIFRSQKSLRSSFKGKENTETGTQIVRKPLLGVVTKIRQSHMDVRNQELSEATFEQGIKSGLVLVEFSAPWCSVRKVHDFFYQEAPTRYAVGFRLCDVDKNPSLASKLGVFSLPTWILFEDGDEVDRFLGHDAKDNFLKCMKSHVRPPSDNS